MTWTYRHRKQIIIITLILFLLLFLGFQFFRTLNEKDKPKKDEIVLTSKEEIIKEEDSKDDNDEPFYQVDIKGEVQVPGIYSVKKGSRIIDVIRLAGDLTEQADTSVINLSKKVQDEMVIIVYSKEEVEQFAETKEKEKVLQENCSYWADSNISNDACIEQEQLQPNEKVSLNSATKEELMTLSGIGEAKADAILKYREEKGQFQSIEELKEVSGIGEELFASIKENITL